MDADGNRETCVVTGNGFALPVAATSIFGAGYTPAVFHTARAHSFGAKVGEFLRAV
jgi:hypothetical protein